MDRAPIKSKDVAVEERLLSGHVELIREVFMYAQRFVGKKFVIMISSSVIEDPRFPTLVRDLGILHRSGIQILLVPGAGKRIDEVLAAYGCDSRMENGIRVSTEDQMPFIKMAAFDVANMLMTQLSTLGLDSVIGSWVRARSLGVVNGVDFQFTGLVHKVDVRLIDKVLEDGMIPILPCIGWSQTGTPYNISSLELATFLAESLQAEKLFFITDSTQYSSENYKLPTDGVSIHETQIVRFSVPAVREFLQMNRKPKNTTEYYLLELAARAASRNVSRVHIVNGKVEGVILKEIFSSVGSGTMIHSDPYDSIRDMRMDDIPAVLDIMEPNVEAGVLVRRDQTDLQSLAGDFVVFVTDGAIRGCGALHLYDDGSAEVAGIAVDPNYSAAGIGQKVVEYLIEKAKRLQLRRVFLLTTRTADWFEALGFRRAAVKDLPAAKREKYDAQRNSRVLTLDLVGEDEQGANKT